MVKYKTFITKLVNEATRWLATDHCHTICSTPYVNY